MTTQKTVQGVFPTPEPHWVGDGFPVRSIFSAHAHDPAAISPFLLLDFAGPHEFPPSDSGRPRGVDQHPHRGFETVTILYHGELQHRDSSGASGGLGPGDVQWMTAAGGIVHEEKHSDAFTRQGGTLEMVQLWVNLPASKKNEPPSYQDIRADDIPIVDLPDGAGTLRVIAGEYNAHAGPAKTHTPMNVWDMKIKANTHASFELPAGSNSIVVVFHGTASVGDAELNTHQGVLLGTEGEAVRIDAGEDGASVLVLSGEPLNEPVAAQGPFVMNTQQEIRQALVDYQTGKMGTLS